MRRKQHYKLLTFYKFVDIADPEKETEQHYIFTRDIGMKGRIYISQEGISATMTCNMWQYHAYRMFLSTNPYFKDIDNIEDKWMDVDGHKFDKMIVKHRKEIVALGDIVTAQQVDEKLQTISPDELKKIIDKQENEDYAILDMRNTYEYKLWHFKGAEPAGTINFRDVDEMFASYKEKYKDKKKVIMYCTWGIRCDKLSVMLKNKWLDNFYALEGWVVTYTNKFGDGNRLGSLYTFDGLVSTRVNPDENHTTIGQCIYTGHHTDNPENCRYSPCNARILARKKDYRLHAGFCSQACYDNARKDILIKTDDSFDRMNYKELRGHVKQGQLTLEQAAQKVQEHLDHEFGEIQYNHTTSQKEDIVDQSMIASCKI